MKISSADMVRPATRYQRDGGLMGRKRRESSVENSATPSSDISGQSVDIPAWLAPVLYGLATLALFRSFVFSDGMLYGSDTVSLGYMAREFYANAMKGGGGFPLWNPIILGGTPFLESLAGGDSLYPPSAILLFLLDPHRALGWKLVLHVFLAGVFMYGWIRCLGLSRASALLSGLAYGLAPFMVSLVHGGQDGKIFVMSLTPLMFWVVESFFLRASPLRFVAISVVVGGIILTTHFQNAYFLFGAVGAYALFRTVQTWRQTEDSHDADPIETRKPSGGVAPALGRFGAFLAAALLGAGIAAVQLVPASSYVVDHSRRTATTTQADGAAAIAYSSSWSLHPEEILGLVVPEFVAASTGDSGWAQNTYWGRNGFKGNHEYGGLVVLLLASVSFFGGARRRLRYFLAGLGGFTLLFCLGAHTPVWRVMYELVPGISLFRAPSLAIFIFGFTTATLMAFGVERLLDLSKDGSEAQWIAPGRFLWGASGALLLGLLLSASGLLTSLWTSVVYRDIPERAAEVLAASQPYILQGFMIAVLLAAATAGVAWGLRTARLAPLGAVVALVLLVGGDLMRIDTAFIRTTDFDLFRGADPNIDLLLERQTTEEPFRVFSLQGFNGQDVRPGMFGLELAAGHHPNDLARYRDVIGMVGSGLPVNLLGSANILRMLNVRYILWPDRLGTPEDQGLPVAVTDNLEMVSQTTIGGRPYETVYRFADLPRARLLGDAVVLSDNEAVPFMLSDDFEPALQVVLNAPPPIPLPGGPVEGSVEWIQRGNNHMRLRVTTEQAALLVLADNWFPAWKVRVDGDDVPVLRANHTLRAVPVTAGSHDVELFYESKQLSNSLRVTLLSLLAVILLPGVHWIRGRGRGGSTSE